MTESEVMVWSATYAAVLSTQLSRGRWPVDARQEALREANIAVAALRAEDRAGD
jgi:hypothetical protein